MFGKSVCRCALDSKGCAINNVFPPTMGSWVAEPISQRSRDKLSLAQLPQLLSQLSPDAESSCDAVQKS
jgi:hypothetical protein